jgi:LacI family transcriptional regulator
MHHVALLIETSIAYGRGLLRGVAQYNREHGSWSTYFQPRGIGDPLPAWLKKWKGDGILARIRDARTADFLRGLNVPLVNLRQNGFDVPVPSVELDHAQVGRTAAEHLASKGLRHFGFVGRPRGEHPGLDARGDAFAAAVYSAGGTQHAFAPPERDPPITWEEEQRLMADWIRKLPKPVGLMAANDEKGLQVLDACRRAGAIVPDDVAVIGVDNDESLCDLTIPPLTSIDVNPDRVGYKAAEMLDQIMNGERLKPTLTLVPPRAVVPRRSTDVLAGEDAAVVDVIRFIRDRAPDPSLRVSDVVEHARVSRTALEPRVKLVLGRTIHQEIERARIERARALLATSDVPIKQVARLSGFSCVQYLTRVFRKATSETPARYRARRRPASGTAPAPIVEMETTAQ